MFIGLIHEISSKVLSDKKNKILKIHIRKTSNKLCNLIASLDGRKLADLNYVPSQINIQLKSHPGILFQTVYMHFIKKKVSNEVYPLKNNNHVQLIKIRSIYGSKIIVLELTLHHSSY